MNYVYDILLNFNHELYEFYEWDSSDKTDHIRKIPLFKVTTKQLIDLTRKEVKMEDVFIKFISGKTEVFKRKGIKTLKYSSLFSDGDKVIGLKFDKNGFIIGRSTLLVSEEEEITDIVLRQKLMNFNYEVIGSIKIDDFKTRKEKEIYKFIKEKISSEENIDKLKYLYFECFGKKETDKEKIIKEIEKQMDSNWDQIYLKLYNFFKLLSL